MEVKRKRAARLRIEARVAQRLCLGRDGGKDCGRICNEPGGANGLCAKHYARIKRATLNLPAEQQDEIRAKYILAGEMLQAQEIRGFLKPKAMARAS